MQHSLRPVGSDDDSGTSTDIPDVFSDDTADESSDNDEEERKLLAAHYLQEAECLDVSQLWQKRYSPRIQAKLNET
ncbi:hypothetical protein BDV12DRAFT_203286 [Aspergillus spectabilis]